MSVSLAVLLQISVSVQVPDTIPARSVVPVVVRATVQGNAAPKVTIPTATGATLQPVSDVTRLGGGFGQAVATREVRYALRAGGPGVVVLSPVVASIGTQQAISLARRITVQPPVSRVVPALVSRAPLSRDVAVNFHSLVTADTVWAGEQLTLQVGVFIDDELRSRLQRNPEYIAPAIDGAVSYDLPVANDALPSRELSGARYRPFIFARALFPLRAGALLIPPARLVYTLGSAGTLFGKQERQTVATQPRTITVRELPTVGRPLAFSGAVGVYSLTASVDSIGGRVGNAVQLSVTVTGVGNVKLLPAPVLSIPSVTTTLTDESISVDTLDLLVRGSKTFRFLLTPTRDGQLPLGDLRYAYFNPARADYVEITAPLGSLRVAPGTVTSDVSDGAAPELLPLRAWSANAAPDVTDAWWFRALLLCLAAPWMALIGRRVSRAIPRRVSRERRRSSRTRVTPVVTDAATLRTGFLLRLAPIAGLSAGDPCGVADVVRRLRRSGVSGDAAEAAGALLMRLDLLTFGATEPASSSTLMSLATEADDLLAQVSQELSTAARTRLAAARVRVLVVAAAGLLAAHASGAQSAPFKRGVAAYSSGRYLEATIAFGDAATSSPASAAAWENLGVAQLMRGDTAGAIVALQRSARLDATASSTRDLLARISPPGSLRTAILPVSANAAWLLLLAITGVLSVSGAVWRWRQRPISNTALAVSATAVALCALLSALAQRSAAATNLVVIRRDTALRTEPVLAGLTAGRARAGEIAEVTLASGTWQWVVATGGRAGWVETEAVRSLSLEDGANVATAEVRIASESLSP